MDWDDRKYTSFDFEGSGTLPEYALQPWRMRQHNSALITYDEWQRHYHGEPGEDITKAWATSLVYTTHDGERLKAHGGLMPTKSDIARMLEDAIKNKRRLLGWNTTFDIMVCLGYGLEDLVMEAKFLDGMLLWRHAFIEPEYEEKGPNKKSYGLKAAVAEFMPSQAGYEEDVDFHDRDPAMRKKLHAYNMRDTAFTHACARHAWGLLNNRQQRAAMIEAESLPMVALANFRGMMVDTFATRELQAKLATEADECLTLLAPLGVTEKVVRSPIQLGKLIFDDWKLPVLKENKSKITGNVSRSTDKEVLHELSFLDPRAKTLRQYREALNNKTKFADTPLKSCIYNEDECTHPSGIIFGTYSGRMTYGSKQGKGVKAVQTGFALHQEKRGAEFRAILRAPPGYTLVEFDAAGQEFRWMAIASKDEQMLQLCLPGEDPHSFMGAAIAEREYRNMMKSLESPEKEIAKQAKADRQLGKIANLCIAEGATVLTDRGPCSIEQVRDDDLVWDGVEFVPHEGVICSGFKHIIEHDNVPGTPTHLVRVADAWTPLWIAQKLARSIQPAMGARWSDQTRAAVRIVDGLIRRAIRDVGRTVRACAVRLWDGARRQPAISGDRALDTMQGMCCASASSYGRQAGHIQCSGQTPAETHQRMVPAVSQPQRSVMAQLRRAWDRVQVRLGAGGGRVCEGDVTASNISAAGHRPCGQRWSLRAWKLALGYARAEPRQQAQAWVYDIVNCGPRHQFACNGRIVHNSLQYRTSAKKLRVVARVQYDLPMELPQAERIRTTYLRTYKGVPLYWDQQIAATKRNGYVETFAGRRVVVKGNWSGMFGWSMGSTAINYRIQGTGADQKYLAMLVVKDYVRSIGAYFAWDLHDGLYFYVPDDKVKEALVEMKKRLDNLPYQEAWGFTPPIPLPFDAKVGPSWGQLREHHFN